MKRYNAVKGGVYDNSVMVEETKGDWVWYEDVEEMLNRLIAMLKMADLYIVEGTPKIDRKFSAIAKAKGEEA